MGKRKRRKGGLTAAKCDPWDLYEKSVQEPEAECDFIEQVWKEMRGRACRTVREDFCGTAVNSIEWVRRNQDHRAVGVDIAPEVLARAEKKAGRLKPAQRKRLRLIEGDVLKTETDPVDSVLAFNFSYFIFKDRAKLKRYFKHAHASLADGGMFLLDAYGGSDSFLVMEEPRECEGFDYIWDQAHYNPVTGDVINHITFKFPDGTKIERAFTYEWRLWTLPELQEVLKEAGFKDVTVYWEGTDEDGEGNGEWAPTRVGEACEGWVAYLAAEK